MSALQDFKKRKINKNWTHLQILSEIALLSDADADADGVTSKEERNSIEKKLALKKGKKRVDFGPNPPPVLPINFLNKIRHMHGKYIVRVIQKPLYNSDISKPECRFSIPVKQVQQEFLTKQEKILLDTCDSHKKKASRIEATLIDPSLTEKKISLRKWETKKKHHIYGSGNSSSSYSSSSYVLMNKWCNIVEENQLKKGDVVQVWAFRAATAASASTSSSRLCFALVVVKRSPSDDQQEEEDKESDHSDDKVLSRGIRFPLF